jgi:hypothetical protein
VSVVTIRILALNTIEVTYFTSYDGELGAASDVLMSTALTCAVARVPS